MDRWDRLVLEGVAGCPTFRSEDRGCERTEVGLTFFVRRVDRTYVTHQGATSTDHGRVRSRPPESSVDPGPGTRRAGQDRDRTRRTKRGRPVPTGVRVSSDRGPRGLLEAIQGRLVTLRPGLHIYVLPTAGADGPGDVHPWRHDRVFSVDFRLPGLVLGGRGCPLSNRRHFTSYSDPGSSFPLWREGLTVVPTGSSGVS